MTCSYDVSGRGAQLLDEYRDHFQSIAVDRVDKAPADPPF